MSPLAPKICAVARRAGVVAALRRVVARRRVSILVYHDPSADRFESHLRYLSARYSFVSLDRVADSFESGSWKSLPDYPLAITFDDGWRGNAQLVEICQRFRCPITVYACSQIVDTARHYWSTRIRDVDLMRLPNADRIRVLVANGMDPSRDVDADRQALTRDEAQAMTGIADFGSHTRFHPVLPTCTDEEAREEIELSKEEVEEFSGRGCTHFAYPYGAHGTRERELVVRAGYRTARTIEPGWNHAGSDRFVLRAFSLPDDASVNRLAAELVGAAFVWRLMPARRWGQSRRNAKLLSVLGDD